MVQLLRGAANGYKEFPISYNLIKQDKPSSSLVTMFPGKGYTMQGPLFHYSTGLFISKGFDVLHVNYDYNTEKFDEMDRDEQITQISEDVNAVLNHVLNSNHTYQNYSLIGKSLGTIALSSIVHHEKLANASVIWLTPLLQLDNVFDKMLISTQRGLCVIGEEDPCYIKSRFEQLDSKENLTSILIPGTDHSLNYPDKPIESIEVLKSVISAISEF